MRIIKSILIMLGSLVPVLSLSGQARAQTLTVLYVFGGNSDGSNPLGSLIRDSQGNIYGTTSGGGTAAGTLYELHSDGTHTVLYNFGGKSGEYPSAGPIRDGVGNLYGTTKYGGSTGGFGTVFKFNRQNGETVLHAFSGKDDGMYPVAGLARDATGNLYGTAYQGGSFAGYGGTAFRIAPNSKFSVLHTFGGNGDGDEPSGGVVLDASGNLYGTTQFGGASGLGTIFKIGKTGAYTLVYSFAGGSDGWDIAAGVVRDKAGNIYGTSALGGVYGYGTVYKLNAQGQHTVLYSFSGFDDGEYPFGGLAIDPAGNLYGTTEQGGTAGLGTIFKLDVAGNKSELYSFTYGDGGLPSSSLIIGPGGNLFGSTFGGGSVSTGNGTLFELAP